MNMICQRKTKTVLFPRCVAIVILLCLPVLSRAEPAPLLLAKQYRSELDVTQYWVSEKYDGVRAYWDGKQLYSRQGHVIQAPDWFVVGFPKRPLDGELWLGRGQFQTLVSAVRKQQPVDDEWHKIRYLVFELPGAPGGFTQRLKQLEALLAQYPSPYLELVPQLGLANRQALQAMLDEVVAQGGEGLMLHRKDAPYLTGRSDALLKLKPHWDAEAKVLAHLPGKGKYRGMLGALLVQTPQGKRFKLGSGFSDEQRQQPPPLGAIVTYRYRGLTDNGLPRFASFLRVRELPEH